MVDLSRGKIISIMTLVMNPIIDLQTIKMTLKKILVKYPVAFAYVFGSTARGATHKDSDLDIAIGFTQKIDDDKFLEIISKLHQQLPVSMEKLDIKNFSELPLLIRFRIIQAGKLVFLTAPAVHRQIALQTADFYHDQYPIMKKFNNLFLQRLANEQIR